MCQIWFVKRHISTNRQAYNTDEHFGQGATPPLVPPQLNIRLWGGWYDSIHRFFGAAKRNYQLPSPAGGG